MKVEYLLGVTLLVVLVVYTVSYSVNTSQYMLGPRPTGVQSAKLPCLANNHCPMGQACSDGFCSEGFMSPSTDMASCNSPECNGINAPCARTGTPCSEGTFCQGNSCVPNYPASQGAEAYDQIGMILN
jgi:hypothetical protein